MGGIVLALLHVNFYSRTLMTEMEAEVLLPEEARGMIGMNTSEGVRAWPTLYLLHHRINNAARMLVETDLSVTDISMACGFSSPGYMWKVFRDINGVSPRAFRKSGRP